MLLELYKIGRHGRYKKSSFVQISEPKLTWQLSKLTKNLTIQKNRSASLTLVAKCWSFISFNLANMIRVCNKVIGDHAIVETKWCSTCTSRQLIPAIFFPENCLQFLECLLLNFLKRRRCVLCDNVAEQTPRGILGLCLLVWFAVLHWKVKQRVISIPLIVVAPPLGQSLSGAFHGDSWEVN